MDKPSIIPTMRYEDANAAIDWLCKNLGFTEHAVFRNEENQVKHAQLIQGTGMIMIGEKIKNEFDKLVKVPSEIDGYNTQSAYLIVEKIEEHYKKAKEGGATIVLELTEEDYGGKSYSCKDPEGYLWNFGTYNPWK